MRLFLFVYTCLFLFVASAQACTELNHLSNAGAHLNVSLDSDLQQMRDQCLSLSASYEKTLCMEPYFEAITKRHSADFAIVQAEGMEDLGLIDDCHIVAHMIGKANVRKFDYKISEAIATCPLNCIQGCAHGAVQAYISERVNPEDISEALGPICDGVKDDKLIRRQCVHGVGHGFLTNNYMSLEQAIKSCGQFRGKEVETCLGGLFMENIQNYLLLPEQEFKNKLPDVCADTVRTGNASYISSCYVAIGEGLMFRTAHNLKKSLQLCGTVSVTAEHVASCQYGALDESKDGEDPFKIVPIE